MRVIILHNPNSEASRVLMAEMGVDPLTDAEAIQAPRGWTVTGSESYATLVCPAFAAYPTCVVIQDDGKMRVKSPVGSLAEAETFALNSASQATCTRDDLLDAISWTEKATIEAVIDGASDEARLIRAMWRELDRRTRPFVREDLSEGILPAFVGAGVFTESRASEILDGLF